MKNVLDPINNYRILRNNKRIKGNILKMILSLLKILPIKILQAQVALYHRMKHQILLKKILKIRKKQRKPKMELLKKE